LARKLNKPNGAAPKAKRNRKTSAAPSAATSTPVGNVTEETRKEFYAKALAARLELDEAEKAAKSKRGAYRAVLKEAKKAGIDPLAITTVLAWRNREPEEVTFEIRQINWMAKAAGLPIGAQLGLFDDKTTVATAVENEKAAEAAAAAPAAASEEQKSEAYLKGYHALEDDKRTNIEDNPYDEQTEPEQHAEWRRGFIARQSKTADELAEKAEARMPKARGNGHATA
jgi:hypothetical protein